VDRPGRYNRWPDGSPAKTDKPDERSTRGDLREHADAELSTASWNQKREYRVRRFARQRESCGGVTTGERANDRT